jgi:hypothetical protein
MKEGPENKGDKGTRLSEFKEIIHSFCSKHLNKELEGYALKLSDTLGRKRKVNVLRGKKEIWAASIIYVIARLNFLFDKENENSITSDIICDFFKTKKSTIGNKATQIEKACNLSIGAEGYCSKDITDSFTFFRTPEGFILPKNMLKVLEFGIEAADDEEAEEIERFLENQQRIEEQKTEERRTRRAEINRKIAEKKKGFRQLSLFDDN